MSFLYESVAVADPAGLHFNSKGAGRRVGNLAFHDLERSPCPGDLYSTHRSRFAGRFFGGFFGRLLGNLLGHNTSSRMEF
jgi:hypothetical protein